MASSNAKVEVYGSPFSQPSRTVWWLCKLLDVPHEVKVVSLSNGEHHSAEYKSVNYFETVPGLRHGNFTLGQSSGILAYLVAKFGKGTSWQPEDPAVIGRVNEYMVWHTGKTGLQPCGAGWVFPAVFASTRDEALIAERKPKFLEALRVLEEYFLSRGTGFIASDQPTTADLMAACDLGQIVMIDDSTFSLDAYPKVKTWYSSMCAMPHFATIHESVMARKKIDF